MIYFCFNTSHVTLYPNLRQYREQHRLVSIHHMLLFIFELASGQAVVGTFQYITCYSLSTESAFCKSEFIQFQYITCYSLSFHSKGTSRRKKMFQYITCYSLSTGVKLNDNEGLGFNTSHVTLYRNVHSWSWRLCIVSIHHMLLFIFFSLEVICTRKLFQYITCYSLSQVIQFVHVRFSPFQYITCYSLSRPERFIQVVIDLFQYITCYSLSVVTPSTVVSTNLVSIHHMLLFITDCEKTLKTLRSFQYITCYSLSQPQPLAAAALAGFNTSHVTLYRVHAGGTEFKR